MRILYFLLSVLCLGLIPASMAKVVCYYDASSFNRQGPGKMSIVDLELALNFCNYLVYGYARIDPETYELKPSNVDLDINQNHFRTISSLKRKFPLIRVLLSVGGDRDEEVPGGKSKYLTLLEEEANRRAFVYSAANILRNYNFDGLDLAWQFPKNPAKEVRSGLGQAWSKFKGFFTGTKAVDEDSEDHKRQFTALVRELRDAFRPTASMLTLTMLPHVDAALFIDIFTVTANVDFVNLATFDFQTPLRDPKVADITASLYEMHERDPKYNVHAQVDFWLNNKAPAYLINVGVATFGRSWVMSRDSGITGYPPIPDAEGPAPAGNETGIAGLLSWPEICDKLSASKEAIGPAARLRKVGDPTRRFGIYAYRAADDNGEHGLWVGYEDPSSAAIKASYAMAKGLGGVAVFDLSTDDFKGICAGERYPILRSIKYKL